MFRFVLAHRSVSERTTECATVAVPFFVKPEYTTKHPQGNGMCERAEGVTDRVGCGGGCTGMLPSSKRAGYIDIW